MTAKRLTLQDGKFQQVSVSSVWCLPGEYYDPETDEEAPIPGRIGVWVVLTDAGLVAEPAGLWWMPQNLICAGYIYDPTLNAEGKIEVHLSGRFPVPLKSAAWDDDGEQWYYPWDPHRKKLLCGNMGGASNSVEVLVDEVYRYSTSSHIFSLLYLGDMINPEVSDDTAEFIWETAEFELRPQIFEIPFKEDAVDALLDGVDMQLSASIYAPDRISMRSTARSAALFWGDANRWQTPQLAVGVLATTELVAGQLYTFPVEGLASVFELGVHVTTAPGSTGICFVGIYSDDEGNPGRLLMQAAASVTASIGMRSANIGMRRNLSPIKRYWFGVLSTVTCSVQAVPAAAAKYRLGMNGSTMYLRRQDTTTLSALPRSTPPGTDDTTAAPLIYMRY